MADSADQDQTAQNVQSDLGSTLSYKEILSSKQGRFFSMRLKVVFNLFNKLVFLFKSGRDSGCGFEGDD